MTCIGARVALALAFIVPIVGGGQVVPIGQHDSTILLRRIDAFASKVQSDSGIVDDSLRTAIATFLDSSSVRNFVKASHRLGWLIALSNTTADTIIRARVPKPVLDTIDVALTLSVRPALAFQDLPENSCGENPAADTGTISGRAVAYVGMQISRVCETLKMVARRTPDSVEWRRSDSVPMNQTSHGTFHPPAMPAQGPRLGEVGCAVDASLGRDGWVSTTAARNIRARLDTLCRLVARLGSARDRVYEVELTMDKRPRPEFVDSLVVLRQQVRALTLLTVLEYQVSRKPKITTDEYPLCRKAIVSRKLPALGAVIGVDSDRGVAGSVVVAVAAYNLLLGGRKVVRRSGGIFELGIGAKPDTLSDVSTIGAFGTLFYDTNSKHLGVGVMAMPFTWRGWRMGAGIATDGSISMKIGVPSLARAHTSTDSQRQREPGAQGERANSPMRSSACLLTD